MAIEVERMIATLEANFTRYDKALNKALGNTDRTFKRIEHRGREMENRLAKLGAGIGRNFLAGLGAGVSLRGAQQLVDSATRIQNALKVAGLQGDELTRVYDRLFESAQANAAPLESLVTLYGRAAIVQKELGVSTEELLTFTNNVALALRVAGTDAQTASGSLLQLSQALGSGVVRAEEFNSILEGALPIAQAAAAGLDEAGGSVARLRALIVDGKVSSEAFFRAFEAGSVILEQKVAGAQLTTAQSLQKLENALVDTAGRMDQIAGASQLTAEAFAGLANWVSELGDTFTAVANGPLSGFVTVLEQIVTTIDTITGGPAARFLFGSDGLKRIQTALGPGAGPDAVSTAPGRGGRLGTDRVQSRIDQAFGPTVRPVSLRDFAPPKAAISGGGGSRATERETDPWDGLRKSAQDYSKTLDEINRRHEELGEIGGSAVGKIVNAFADGKLEAEELLSIVADLVQQLLRMPSGGLGGSGGGFLSGLLSSIFHAGGVVGSGGSRRMVSPLAFAGAPRMHAGGVAGLRPDEVPAILQRGEVVLPKNGGRAAPAAPQAVTISVNVEGASGDDHIVKLVQQGVAMGLSRYDKTLDRTIAGKVVKSQAMFE